MSGHPCSVPGCPSVASRPGRCPRHARAGDQSRKRQQAWRDYGAAWRAIRERVLAKEPACRHCGDPAVEVDHLVPLRLGGTHDRSNLQALCRSCHSAKTASENGFGGARTE